MITIELEASLPIRRIWPKEIQHKWWVSGQWFKGRPYRGWWNRKAYVRVLGVALIIGAQWKLKEDSSAAE